MHQRIVPFVLTVVGILALLLAAGEWMANACLPYEVHSFKWQCELALPFLGLSFAGPTALYGYFACRSPWIEGLLLSLLAAAVATAMSYFQPFFGGPNAVANATTTFYHALLPAVLGALAGYKLQRAPRASVA